LRESAPAGLTYGPLLVFAIATYFIIFAFTSRVSLSHSRRLGLLPSLRVRFIIHPVCTPNEWIHPIHPLAPRKSRPNLFHPPFHQRRRVLRLLGQSTSQYVAVINPSAASCSSLSNTRSRLTYTFEAARINQTQSLNQGKFTLIFTLPCITLGHSCLCAHTPPHAASLRKAFVTAQPGIPP
jgi:hypothetical protein